MDVTYEKKYHTLEEKHWWFTARRDMVFSLIKQLRTDPRASILEIGCSGGPLLQMLRKDGFTNLTGIDVSEAAIALSRTRGFDRVKVMDGANLLFADESFDLIIASDVLEHIHAHQHALSEWRRVLKPGGKIIVFVPAFESLWSQHDVVNHHYRRYTQRTLVQLTEATGMHVKTASYWNSLLFLPTYLIRQIQNRLFQPRNQPSSGGDQLWKVNPVLNALLIYLLKIENRLPAYLRCPFGVSVFVVAQKPSLA